MTRPPRVVLIAPHVDRVGGYERQALALSRALVRRGISTWLVSDNHEDLPPREHRDGVLIYRLSAPNAPWWLQRRRRSAPPDRESDLAVFLRQHAGRYDAVHGQAFCPPCDVGMATAHALGKPALVKVATEGDPTEIATGGPDMQKIWRGFQSADRFLCISHAIRDEFRSLGVPEEKLFYNPNGIDTEEHRPPTQAERRRARLALDVPDETTVLASVGRLAQRKGIDVLLRAWALVPEAVRRTAILLIVGDGEEAAALRALAGALGLDASLRFLGERRDVPRLLHACDGFAFSSRREGLSNALLEAMSSGLPVAATRIGGNVDLVADGAHGLLCEADDPAGLATAMERLLADAALRARMGTAARRRILDAYGFDAVIDRLLPLYGIIPPPRPRERTDARAA